MSMLESEVMAKIDIWVMRDGKAPSIVKGLDDFGTINILSSVLKAVNKTMADKPKDYWEKWERPEIKEKLYKMMAEIFGTEDPFPMINALALMINRINERVARDKHVENIGPLVVAPDLKVMQ